MVLRVIQILLVILMAIAVIAVILDYRRHRNDEEERAISKRDDILYFIIGNIVNFFDVLGIGSFAPTLSLYNMFNLKVPERKIGGTLNAGVAGVVTLEAILFISSVEVDLKTYILLIVAALCGTPVGVKLNEKVDVNIIRYIMGTGLFVAAGLMLLSKMGLMPIGGELTGLTGGKLILMMAIAFVLGIALMFGIGNYAPCMACIYLLGMNPICAFPIMTTMGCTCSSSSAFQSIKNGLIVRHSALWMMIGGFIGCTVAYFIVKQLSVAVLQWLVIVVVIYAAIGLFRKAAQGKKAQATA